MPATEWRAARIAEIVRETHAAATLVLDVEGWDGHRAGQHVDVRLTADDGYRAQRSYSIASAPEDGLSITVERLEDGEVSPWFVDVAAPATPSSCAARSAAGSCGRRPRAGRCC